MANNQSKVKTKAGNLDDIVATNLAANEDKVNQAKDDPTDIISPEGHINNEDFKEKIEATTDDLVQAIKTFNK